MGNGLVLAVAAERTLRNHLSSLLKQWGYIPFTAGSVDEALRTLASARFDLSVVAMELNGADGIDFLRRMKLQGADSGPVIMLFDPSNIKRIGEAAALGAEDFLQKPFTPDQLESVVRAITEGPRRPSVRPDAEDLATRLEQEIALWRSPRMQEVRRIIEQAARVDITVLLGGETGTGKDLVARAIHHRSLRQRRPIVKVNCAAVPRELLESELFGHERGAFTGAHQLKIGKFEAADHGTIFLDEIGDLHPALQAKLLHVLQDGEFSRVGGRSTTKVDVRIIAATNQDLEQGVAAGRFREDLYYRLNVVHIVVPPLRERTEEIPLLINYFVQRHARAFHREGFTVPPQVMDRLLRHGYPGNVRELENIVKRMIVLNDPFLRGTPLTRIGSSDNGNGTGAPGLPLPIFLKKIGREAARAAERETILKVLEQTRWNRLKAAKQLNISYRALLYKIKQMGLEPEGAER